MQNVTSSGLLIYSVKGEQFPGKEPIAVDLHEYVSSLWRYDSRLFIADLT